MKKLLAVLLCTGMFLSGCATKPVENEPEQQETSTNEQFDIVIVGAGGAGLSAAVEAYEQGANNVLVLEF